MTLTGAALIEDNAMKCKFEWINNPYWNPGPLVYHALLDRVERPRDWLNDGSKYLDLRFDSRTGNVLIVHEKHTAYGKIILIED